MGKQIEEKVAASWVFVRELNTKFLGTPTDENLQALNDACRAHQELMAKVNAILTA